MSVENHVENITEQQQQGDLMPNPFDEGSWLDGNNQAKQIDVNDDANTPDVDIMEDTAEKFDHDKWVKENFGYENVETAKKEIDSFKNNTQQEKVKFANEESENIYKALLEGKTDDVSDYLSNKRRIDKLSISQVDSTIAEEILKLSIQQKNKNLTEDEVEFAFKDKYSIPEKPKQKIDELDEEFEERVSEWSNNVDIINKRMVIDAKIAQPEIEKLKSELVLPNIQTNNLNEANKQEELQQIAEVRKKFESALENQYKNFDGFSITFKDESAGIEIPISYKPTEEEKIGLKNALADFNHSEYFGNRWFAEDGSPQINQMMSDKYFLENREKIMQKVANESAMQMKLKMISYQSNINLSGSTTQQAFLPQNNNSEMDKFAASIFMG
jgi:hypothetical protein